MYCLGEYDPTSMTYSRAVVTTLQHANQLPLRLLLSVCQGQTDENAHTFLFLLATFSITVFYSQLTNTNSYVRC